MTWKRSERGRDRDSTGRLRRMHAAAVLAMTALSLVVVEAAAQMPDKYTNLQVLPKDISRTELIEIMRSFSFALGVRCQYCHVGGDGRSFEGVEFDKDDDPHKRQARFMMQMVETLNEKTLAKMPDRDDPPVVMECKTCHRGRPKPLLLIQELRLALDAGGIDSTLSHLRGLRKDFDNTGAYDFGEWETNQFAERLAREGRTADAVAVYELNAEYFPESASIALNLAQLYEEQGDSATAIRHYKHVLELAPRNKRAKERLEALTKR